MARDPGSVWAPLPEAGVPDGLLKDKFIVHSTGNNGTAAATRRYFELTHILPESTFIVGQGPWDPTLQIMDSTDRADANVAANGPGISVEVVGDGRSGYNAWQRSELIRLGIWARQTHPEIRPQIVPVATGAGYGWHIMFGAPGPWTTVAKICPGGVRINELKNDIFPAIFAGRYEESDPLMSASLSDTVKNQISVIVKEWVTKVLRDEKLIVWPAAAGGPQSVTSQLQLDAQGLAMVNGKIDGVIAKLSTLEQGKGLTFEQAAEAGRVGARELLGDLRVVPVDEVPSV